MKLSIPIELCSFVLKYRIVNPFHSYLIMKSKCSGKLKFDKKELSKVLNVSNKTLDKHLFELRKLNWVGYNPKSGILFIRGFEKIREMHYFKSRLAIVCTETDLKTFRPFLFAGAASSIILFKKRQIRRFLAEKKGNAYHRNRQPFFHPLSVGYLAKLIHFSMSGVVKLKTQAEAAGYITTKEDIQATVIPFLQISHYWIPKNENRGYFQKKGKFIGIQSPDLISTNMDFSKRKKSVTIVKGYRGNTANGK